MWQHFLCIILVCIATCTAFAADWWRSTIVDEPVSNRVGEYTSLAILSSGYPAISYTQAAYTQNSDALKSGKNAVE